MVTALRVKMMTMTLSPRRCMMSFVERLVKWTNWHNKGPKEDDVAQTLGRFRMKLDA